jgi:GNAT superfamily N-acetyltransferase
MPITGKEARKEAGKKVAELRRLSDELTAIMDELPLPTPEEFESIRRGETAWTEEAHIAAVIRNADFYTEEAATVLTDYGGTSAASLLRLWKKGERPGFPLERSLRYLVQARAGVKIEPSETETYYFDPSARGRGVARMFLELLLKMCADFLRRFGGMEGEAAEAREE